jgi:hypothetical protein
MKPYCTFKPIAFRYRLFMSPLYISNAHYKPVWTVTTRYSTVPGTVPGQGPTDPVRYYLPWRYDLSDAEQPRLPGESTPRGFAGKGVSVVTYCLSVLLVVWLHVARDLATVELRRRVIRANLQPER